jgi:hypothetical protein
VAEGCVAIESWVGDAGTGGNLVCVGPAPLTLTLVPLTSPDVTSYLWSFGDGSPTSAAPTPTHTFVLPGGYDVRLIVGSPAGTLAVHHDPPFVQVRPNALGGACDVTAQCAPELICTCPTDDAAATSCPAAFGHALCTKECIASDDCGQGSVCIDLGVSAPWRTPLCLRACAGAGSCRAGFECRQLPTTTVSEPGWATACFPSFLGDLASPCLGPSGEPRPEGCVGGVCLELGALGYCSADCRDRPCPSGTACARLLDGTERMACLATCAEVACEDDPLLACEEPGPGGLGFEVLDPEAPAGPYCAPRRCRTAADCRGLACVTVGGEGFCQAS